MLHCDALPPRVLPVLRELARVPVLGDHALVGGTALALRYGHRISVDIDLFSTRPMDTDAVTKELETRFGERFSYRKDQRAKWAVFGFIDEVKVDLIHSPHPCIAPVEEREGFRMYADADIAPMKVQAILDRAKKKDFFDLDLLLRAHGLPKIMEWHRRKYPDHSIAISIPSAITWFKDAEDSEDPVSLKGQTWAGVKTSISEAVSDFLR